jgi:hypothetical protein
VASNFRSLNQCSREPLRTGGLAKAGTVLKDSGG